MQVDKSWEYDDCGPFQYSITEYRGGLAITPASILRGTGFKFRLEDRLFGLICSVVFLIPSRQIPCLCLKTGPACFLPYRKL